MTKQWQHIHSVRFAFVWSGTVLHLIASVLARARSQYRGHEVQGVS